MIRDLENNLINLRDGANRHRLLLGETGSGKTWFCYRMLEDALAQGKTCLIFDYSGSFTDEEMKKGDFKLIKLGVGMKLPEGYKANVYPRSSTYKNFGIILANSVGQIDNSYSGDADEWRFPAIAMRDTIIHKNDRICQFEIQKIQPEIEFIEVEHLDEESRGGIGSTGKA